MYASFAGIEIPRVAEVDVSRILHGDTKRTIGGKLQRDVSAVKRIWTLRSTLVTRSELQPLINHLESTLYAEGAFWLKEFGDQTNTVSAMIDADSLSEQIAAFGKDGEWHVDGRGEITWVIEEV